MFNSFILFLLFAAGLAEKARALLAEMRTHGLQPNSHHHVAMIDLLARAGRLDEAEKYLLAHAPTDVVGFTCVMAACRERKDTARLERLAQLQAKLPTVSADDVAASSRLLANTYAATGQWDDRHRVVRSGTARS